MNREFRGVALFSMRQLMMHLPDSAGTSSAHGAARRGPSGEARFLHGADHCFQGLKEKTDRCLMALQDRFNR